MFKKFKKPPYEEPESPYQDLASRPANPFTSDLMNVLEPQAYEEEAKEEEPETVLAAGVAIKGTMSFQKLIRIDGSFEGELISTGKLIVGPTGSVKAHIDLEEAFISGKVEGNIKVKTRLVLRGRAEVRGDITALLLSVDEGVSIVGRLNVVQDAVQETEETDPYSEPDN